MDNGVMFSKRLIITVTLLILAVCLSPPTKAEVVYDGYFCASSKYLAVNLKTQHGIKIYLVPFKVPLRKDEVWSKKTRGEEIFVMKCTDDQLGMEIGGTRYLYDIKDGKLELFSEIKTKELLAYVPPEFRGYKELEGLARTSKVTRQRSKGQHTVSFDVSDNKYKYELRIFGKGTGVYCEMQIDSELVTIHKKTLKEEKLDILNIKTEYECGE